ncbi:unnamed protein product [Urochloa decumbens]|uniref:F-box domain-containing protein n=1 Tax=Urochloa decumbens TaxID=240449 RepID=A0ABC9FN58_9POAL
MDEGALPLDVVHEILLHLPAKPLCRFRAVCRPWRRLLSDPLFMAAHGARHPGPHLIASYICNTEHDILLSIVDHSGQIIKQIRRKEEERVTLMASDLVCITTLQDDTYRLLNPSTGAVYHMLDQLAQEHIDRGLELRDYSEPVHLFGLAAGKGEYKVLRMLIRFAWNGAHQYLFEVCTLNRNRGARWRAKQAPPMSSMWDKCARVVIDGVVYLLNVDVYNSFNSGLHVTEKDWIVSFDLETEEWRPNIRGPSSLLVGAAAVDMLERLNGRAGSRHIALTNLNGSLVIVLAWSSCMDMWFLMDSEEGLWVKQYSMQVAPYKNHRLVRPLLVLDDGRIVVHITNMRLLQIYDPRSNNFTDVVRLSHCWEVSMYTGNLLTLDGHNQ